MLNWYWSFKQQKRQFVCLVQCRMPLVYLNLYILFCAFGQVEPRFKWPLYQNPDRELSFGLFKAPRLNWFHTSPWIQFQILFYNKTQFFIFQKTLAKDWDVKMGFWGWGKRQTKSTNKQTNKVNKIYLGWAQAKYGEQIMGTNT